MNPTYTGGLSLRVLDDSGTVHSLTSATDLRADTYKVRESLDAGNAGVREVRLGDVALRALGATLLGAATRDELPAVSIAGRSGGGYRAELTHDDGSGDPPSLVLDGVVPRASIEHRPSRGEWSFPLLAAASEDFWTRLEDVGLLALGAAGLSELDYFALPYLKRIQTAVNGEPPTATYQLAHDILFDFPGLAGSFPDYIRCYTVESVVRAVLESAGVTLAAPLPDWPLTVPTVSGEVTRAMTPRLTSLAGWDATVGAYGPTSLTLPAWSGRELVEAVVEAAGWTTVVSYEPFPAVGLVVRFYPARPAPVDPLTLAVLDGREAEGGTVRRGEPAPDDAAGVVMANALAGASPRMESATAVPFSNSSYLAAPPPPRATLATSAWTFERKDSSGREQEPTPRGEIVELPFAVPSVGPRRPAIGLDSLLVSEGDVTEEIVYGVPVIETGQPYLVAVGLFDPASTGTPTPHAIHSRAGYQGSLTNEVWADTLYRMRSVEAGGREIAAGAWHTSGLVPALVTGQPSAGASLDGQAWVVRESETVLASRVATLTLERSASESAPVPDYGAVARLGTVEALNVRYRRWSVIVASSIGYTEALVAEWLPPAVEAAGGVAYYEVQVEPDGEAAGPWVKTFATGFVRSGDDVSEGTWYTIRVRPVSRLAAPGPVVSLRVQAELAGDASVRMVPPTS